MLVEFLIKNAQTQYTEEFNFIETKFSEYKASLNRLPSIFDEVQFLLNLKASVYRNGYDLTQEGKAEEGIKCIALSNIIHSMLFSPDFYTVSD